MVLNGVPKLLGPIREAEPEEVDQDCPLAGQDRMAGNLGKALGGRRTQTMNPDAGRLIAWQVMVTKECLALGQQHAMHSDSIPPLQTVNA